MNDTILVADQLDKLTTAEILKLLMDRNKKSAGDIAKSMGTSRQNVSAKLSKNNFKESELRSFAGAIGYNVKISFVKKEGSA